MFQRLATLAVPLVAALLCAAGLVQAQTDDDAARRAEIDAAVDEAYALVTRRLAQEPPGYGVFIESSVVAAGFPLENPRTPGAFFAPYDVRVDAYTKVDHFWRLHLRWGFGEMRREIHALAAQGRAVEAGRALADLLDVATMADVAFHRCMPDAVVATIAAVHARRAAVAAGHGPGTPQHDRAEAEIDLQRWMVRRGCLAPLRARYEAMTGWIGASETPGPAEGRVRDRCPAVAPIEIDVTDATVVADASEEAGAAAARFVSADGPIMHRLGLREARIEGGVAACAYGVDETGPTLTLTYGAAGCQPQNADAWRVDGAAQICAGGVCMFECGA